MNSSRPEEYRMEGLRMKVLRYRNSRHILCQRDKISSRRGDRFDLMGRKIKKKKKTINPILKIWCGVTQAS